jgi:DNA-binding NarL/FixJ family response regulator
MICQPSRKVGLATDRSAVRCLLEQARAGSSCTFELEEMVPDPDSVTPDNPQLTGVAAMVIDMGRDPDRGLRFCAALRSLRPDLPIAALLCCVQGFTFLHLRQLLQIASPCGLIDSEATAVELRRSVEQLLRGRTSISLQLTLDGVEMMDTLVSRGRVPRSSSVLGAHSGRHFELMTLVARGLSDQEIGQHLNLSRHTVHHCIERLRGELDLKNRVELAAWAGKHGLYSRCEPEHQATASDLVRARR